MPVPTYIIGHRNPDADSICSAIAYADLKNRLGERHCVAARCGNSNARIDAILQRFGEPLPLFLGDVTPRVRDIMVTKVFKTRAGATCFEAMELIENHDVRVLPVVDEKDRLQGIVSVFQLGEFFIPRPREPREMRRVHTSVGSIVRALQAGVTHLSDGDRVEDLFVRVGAMDIVSFGHLSENEGIPADRSIIVVGDRKDIQRKAVELGVRLLVITGGLEADPGVVEAARRRGVGLIVSPHDSATTAWIIRTASTIDRMVAKAPMAIRPEMRLSDVRRRMGTANIHAIMVVDENNQLNGIFTKTDLIKPVPTSLILVDHNELSQAVPGAGEVTILEIVDHHRLGNEPTQQPILFLNEPVGSTCTIVADLYRRHGMTPTPAMAGIMMSGMISDTLHLNSPTTTEKDRDLLVWLEAISRVSPADLAHLIFSSGSVIIDLEPDKVVRSDFKVYDEHDFRFSVSQVEELGFSNFWKHADSLTDALKRLQERENLYFATLLITDINTQNSLLVAAGAQEFIEQIPYPPVRKNEIFDLQGIVSRKKQVVPFITGILRSLGSGTARR